MCNISILLNHNWLDYQIKQIYGYGTNLTFLILTVSQKQTGNCEEKQCCKDDVLPGVEDFLGWSKEDNIHCFEADLGPVDRIGHSDRLGQETAGPAGHLGKLCSIYCMPPEVWFVLRKLDVVNQPVDRLVDSPENQSKDFLL